MFMYFPDNYPWSMAVLLALNAGGVVSDIDAACAPLKAKAAANDAAANAAWFDSWLAIADRAANQADADAAAGRALSAARKYRRACAYYMAAERQIEAGAPRRAAAYERLLATFAQATALGGDAVERVEVPYRDTTLPGLYVPARGAAGPAPAMVHMDGLDVMKEFLYLGGVADALAARGVATLLLDHPGVGEAIRKRGLALYPETEVPAGAGYDWLAARPDVDAARIGVMAISLGGYYAPRAAACDARFRCCVAWGAQWDYGAVTADRMAGDSSELSVSNWAAHMMWVFGKTTMDEVLEVTRRMTLVDAMARITCPLLIVHGENDRQIALASAEKCLAAATASARAELKVFTRAEGGAEHCQVDNGALAVDYISDWVAEVLGGRTAAA